MQYAVIKGLIAPAVDILIGHNRIPFIKIDTELVICDINQINIFKDLFVFSLNSMLPVPSHRLMLNIMDNIIVSVAG